VSGLLKAQLSLEFLMYLSLAGIGMFYVLLLIAGYHSTVSETISQYKYSEFMSILAQAMYSNSGEFEAAVPQQLCMPGNSLITPKSSGYYLPEDLRLYTGSVCPSHTEALYINQSSNGTWVLK
jgi:hypothetical protein